jgi:hypothetical protein
VSESPEKSIWARSFGRQGEHFISSNEHRAQLRTGGVNLRVRWRAFRAWMASAFRDGMDPLEAAEIGFYAGAASAIDIMLQVSRMSEAEAARVTGHLRREIEEFAKKFESMQ